VEVTEADAKVVKLTFGQVGQDANALVGVAGDIDWGRQTGDAPMPDHVCLGFELIVNQGWRREWDSWSPRR
jgi:hypothetical protein